MLTTNVKSSDLNYSRYSTEKYDRDIRSQIWAYDKLHEKIVEIMKSNFDSSDLLNVLERGIGTGNTALEITNAFLNFHSYIGVDFSKVMIEGAMRKLPKSVTYVLKYYSDYDFPEGQDVVVSAIGFHHQKTEGKKSTFKKAFNCLNQDGLLIIADLTTWQNPELEAKYSEKQDEYLKLNASDEKSKEEWLRHHRYLNWPAESVGNHLEYMMEAGFKEV